jgi:hypothetical protein
VLLHLAEGDVHVGVPVRVVDLEVGEQTSAVGDRQARVVGAEAQVARVLELDPGDGPECRDVPADGVRGVGERLVPGNGLHEADAAGAGLGEQLGQGEGGVPVGEYVSPGDRPKRTWQGQPVKLTLTATTYPLTRDPMPPRRSKLTRRASRASAP